MNFNPYSPPKADVSSATENVPPLWNPNAAANWCLLLSTAFGAYLHMKNWEALGESRKANISMVWMIVSILFLLGNIFLGTTVSGTGAQYQQKTVHLQTLNLPLLLVLLGWYFLSARAQVKYIKDRFGDNYPRKGWLKPIFGTLGLLFGVAILTSFLTQVFAQ